jgi:23S rRNA pseudouridine2605 synthase
MRKSSSDFTKGGKPGPPNSFGKKDAKPFKKKSGPAKRNYDGREPSAGGDIDPRFSSPSRPYSGRSTDGPAKRSFDKAPGGGNAGEGRKFDGDRKSGKSFDKPRRSPAGDKPFSDRPKFRSDDRAGADERKPRKEFDKPFRKEGGDRPFNKEGRKFDGGDRKSGGNYDKPFRKDDSRDGAERKPRREFDKPFSKERRKFDSSDRKPRKAFDKPFRKEDDNHLHTESIDGGAGTIQDAGDHQEARPRKDYNKPARTSKPSDSRPFRERPKSATGKPPFDKKGGAKDFDKKAKAEKGPRTFSDVVNNAFNEQSEKRSAAEQEEHPGKRQQFEDKIYGELEEETNEDRPKKPFELKKNAAGKKRHIHDHSEGRRKKYKDDEDDQDEDDKDITQKDGPRLEMPLNKFIAHSGECSRRDAAELVRQGKVKVNGELVLDPGYRVQNDDKVTMSGKKLTPQKGMVYILLNKPKGFITTNDDPQGRKTVMELVGNAGVDRLFPVGRLDRDTSGLLLITNDGDLTQKLCHPTYNIKKVYQVTLDKALTKADFEKIVAGVELEDGKAIVDAISYLEKKNELGLEIHSGRNRIVRRIFESLGYVVEKLDRVMYAGLTKKNLPRSKWRYLDEREVVLLKHFKS